MESGSRAAVLGHGAANFTSAHVWMDLLNTSSATTRWDSSVPAEGTGLDEQRRLVREQAYRDFSTTVQVFILICSLLGESPLTLKHAPMHAGQKEKPARRTRSTLQNCAIITVASGFP